MANKAAQYLVLQGGFKYIARDILLIFTPYRGPSFRTEHYSMNGENGNLTMEINFACDGPSGPMRDTDAAQCGAWPHDIFYDALRRFRTKFGKKWWKQTRKLADMLARQHWMNNGMSWFRAWYAYNALRPFGKKAAKVKREVQRIPFVQATPKQLEKIGRKVYGKAA